MEIRIRTQEESTVQLLAGWVGFAGFRDFQTGWVGFAGFRENSLRTAVHPSDHLESLLFAAHYC